MDITAALPIVFACAAVAGCVLVLVHLLLSPQDFCGPKIEVVATFRPMFDITLSEYALIASKTRLGEGPVFMTLAQWDALDPSIRRHFEGVMSK